MLRRILNAAFVIGLISLAADRSRAEEDPRFASDFVQALRERGLYDVSLQYLDHLRQDPQTPADLRRTLDYEEGRTLIQEATHSSDPDISKVKLELAKVKIEAFVKANPDLPQTTEALVDLAHLLYERGNTEADMAGEARAVSDRDSKLAVARGYYANARSAYSRAFDRLNGKLVEFPKFIPSEDPRKLERERLRNTVMQAELQKTIVDYYEAQTFSKTSNERAELLNKALIAFEEIYKRYRNQMAGFTARMWQGKCFEELGKLGEATGIYKELLDHPDPALRPLQKQVDYFRIIVMGKRKEYALAVDESVNWLRLFPKDRRSFEALGVQLELAKNVIEQLPGLTGTEHDKAIRLATDCLKEVVSVISPLKPEAVALLQKYRPNAALVASDIAKLNYEDAVAQAKQAISTLDYENAIVLLKMAIRKAGPTRDAAKVNSARYMLAFSEMMTKRYYEAAVIGEHVARNYPRDEWAAKSADLAMQAFGQAYNAYTQGNRTADLDRLVDLARYTIETWPETEQGDLGRLRLGLVKLGQGHYSEAITAFDSVRTSSATFVDSQTSSGEAHWKLSLALRDKGNTKEAELEVQQAIAKYTKSLKDRRDANVPETDLSLVNNVSDLAQIQLEIGKPAEALTLLQPIAKLLSNVVTRSPALNLAYTRVVAGILRGHVATGKVDLAVADMKTIESIGGAGNSAASLYLELGLLLEKEIESLKKRNDIAGLKRTEESYQRFLKALVSSKSGQTFQSLKWAADNLLKLGSAKEALDVYTNIVETYGKDPQFLKTPKASDMITRVRVKQVAALRNMGKLADAETLLNELLEQNKQSMELQMEKGYLLDAKAEAKQGKWVDAYNHWKTLALKLGNMKQKPLEYYEAWYQATTALQRQGQRDLAKSTMVSVMRLSPPALGSPEMKAKYELMIKQLSK